MLIDHLNLNHFRIFEAVYRLKSMTKAAVELHMTQSGVSQHIKSLEEMVDVKLFDRIKQRLLPTPAAEVLFHASSSGLQQIEQSLLAIKGGDRELKGVVSIGMPVEFGHNMVLPQIALFSQRHPGIRFKFKLGLAQSISEMLLEGELDFAFVDSFKLDRRIRTEKVYDETLELCIGGEYLRRAGKPKHNRDFYESLSYIEYQEGEPILKMWFAHHLDKRTPELNVRCFVTDTKSVGKLIAGNVGAGVLPTHLIASLQEEGHEIHRLEGCGKPLKNAISLAYLEDRSRSTAVQATLDEILAALRGA